MSPIPLRPAGTRHGMMTEEEEANVVLYDFFKNRKIGSAEVKERFGVGPERVVDVQALAGDPTDNVPGIPGIGVKIAAELINAYGDLDTLLARAGEVKQPRLRESLIEHKAKALLSRELVRLRDDVPVPVPLDELQRRPSDPETLRAFLEAQGFCSVVGRLGPAVVVPLSALRDGYYRTRMVSGGPWCPVRIWFGPPADPDTGELIDRSPRWQATLRGLQYEGDVASLWSWCAKHPITEAEHNYMVATARHAVTHEPEMPEASPREKIDFNKLRVRF